MDKICSKDVIVLNRRNGYWGINFCHIEYVNQINDVYYREELPNKKDQ